MEKIIHGHPSGVDVQTVLSGGCLKFVKGNEKSDNLIERYSVKTSSLFNFVLVNTNKQREGKFTIQKVKQLSKDDPAKFEDAMGMLGDITGEIIECLGLGNPDPQPVD